MKYITITTEKLVNEMVKNNQKYGKELQYLLDAMKGRVGYYGGTIKEMKKHNETLDNTTQINVIVSNVLRGMGKQFEKYIYVVDCADLHYVSIYDFNKLVKICYNESNWKY